MKNYRYLNQYNFAYIATFILSLSIMLFSSIAFAGENAPKLDWFLMLMKLLGGLALFLYGMEQLIKSLLVVAGEQMKNLLAKLTTNRVMGAITGAGVTAVIQSSSVTSVLTVGFVSAGLMTVGQAAGVIMGANLGTTITAQVIAFKVTNFALLMIAVGFAIQFFSKLNKKIAIGRLIMGLGLIFFGMNIMSEGMAPLKDYQPFLDLMLQMQTPIYGILIGFIFTALVQSSSATIGIIIVMASNGFLTLPAGIALAMGANVGTTVTALLATIGKSREAKRTGYIHLLFNVIGVLIFLPFIPELAHFSAYLTNPNLIDINQNTMNIAFLAEHTPRQIANANTLFNFISLVIFLPLIPVFIWVVNKIVPILDNEKNSAEFEIKFLDESLLSTPSMAMQAVRQEIEIYQQKHSFFYKRVMSLIENPNLDKLSREDLNLQRFRSYQRKILRYLGKINQSELSSNEQNEYLKLLNVVNVMESMLETIEFNVLNVLHSLFQNSTKPSETMNQLVGQLSNEVGKSIDRALLSISEQNKEPALSVIAIKPTIDLLIQEALKHQIKKFQPTEERLTIFRFEMQLVDGFKQLHTLAKRIARLQLIEVPIENKIDNPGFEKVD
ncbi:Na/Pi cotransporter family protein [Thiomicrorhabdus sp. Milos-T2]|uniref:Na/Pi cotransporter family protein n=1 Tax=Thiomicrorhabdus sp. Milos-T2 TaxID=90814 RepID=UPI00068BAD8F|nr:Na/Pi cotransporter family protein [Thiomicrorhabdus sp. Milos-T2]